MSPFINLTKVKHEVKRGKRWQSLAKPYFLNIAAICLIMVMGTLYLVQVNRATTKGYEIRDLEKRINRLEENSQRAKLEIAELQSIDSIQQRIGKLGMVPVNHVEYVKLPGTSVAMR